MAVLGLSCTLLRGSWAKVYVSPPGKGRKEGAQCPFPHTHLLLGVCCV